ncbi:hypothetical protein BLD44_025460 [Mastigocladus laminosus UU774]|nr:hypothetical protein BLD44_025460 [Mastigocladus laminosus UU774]
MINHIMGEMTFALAEMIFGFAEMIFVCARVVLACAEMIFVCARVVLACAEMIFALKVKTCIKLLGKTIIMYVPLTFPLPKSYIIIGV